MVRKIERNDHDEYIKMAEDFYGSSAVLSPVPKENFEKCFAEMLRSDEYAEGFIIESDGKTAGYGLTAKTYSQEAGGIVIWLEELYIKRNFRSKGLGSEFFKYIMKNRQAARYRLETEPENERAAALYRRLGFEDFGYCQMKKK